MGYSVKKSDLDPASGGKSKGGDTRFAKGGAVKGKSGAHLGTNFPMAGGQDDGKGVKIEKGVSSYTPQEYGKGNSQANMKGKDKSLKVVKPRS